MSENKNSARRRKAFADFKENQYDASFSLSKEQKRKRRAAKIFRWIFIIIIIIQNFFWSLSNHSFYFIFQFSCNVQLLHPLYSFIFAWIVKRMLFRIFLLTITAIRHPIITLSTFNGSVLIQQMIHISVSSTISKIKRTVLNRTFWNFWTSIIRYIVKNT